PLQHTADRAQVFDGAGQIPMTGAWPLDIFELLELRVAVGDGECHGTADRGSLPDSGEDLDRIGFELLPAAAAVTSLAALELAVDLRGVDRQSRGKTVDQRKNQFAVRFTGSQQSEHVKIIQRPRRACCFSTQPSRTAAPASKTRSCNACAECNAARKN